MTCSTCGKTVIWFDPAHRQLTHGPGVTNRFRDHFPVVDGVTDEEGKVL